MAFQKGTSGNPKGRPQKELSAQKLRNLISENDVSDILKSMIDQAKQGDIQAAKLILDKVLPNLKSVDVTAIAEVTHIPTLADMYRTDNVIDEVTAAKVYAEFIKGS